ncbi:sensor histidine kinase [Ramlibacter rhizophilus]|nr:HAMP domain-containing sensor histidine kinase [Ramlibacter rhizophilus]
MESDSEVFDPLQPTRSGEAALRESEERFRLTFDEAPIGMAGTDGRFLRVNKVLCEIVGYTAEELTGLTFQAITHPEDLDSDLALAGQLARGEIPRYTLEKRYLRKDGSIVHIRLSGSVLRDAQSRPLHFIAQVEDVTERWRTEQAQQFLAELGPALDSSLDCEQILDRVVALTTRTLADACIVIDACADERLLHKRAACRDPARQRMVEPVLHLTLDPAGPHLLANVMRARQATLLRHPSDESLAALSQTPEHLRLLRALEIASLVAVPLVVAGHVIGAVALIASAGSREHDARDLLLVGQLGSRMALAMANARLYRMASEASQRRDEVLAIVAHDLRNPLNVIATQAALLRRAQHRQAIESAIAGTIGSAAVRMTRLIEDLLDISRIEAGQLSVHAAPLDTLTLLREYLAAQQAPAQAAAIALRLDAPPQLAPVRADRDRLFQVLDNLVGNALKFAGDGGQVTLGAEEREGEVLFWVHDTGPGIPAEHLPHLFDRFWQAHRARRDGAGLGLPIAKGIAEAQGGHMGVDSAPGQGARFFFTLPRADRSPGQPAAGAASGITSSTSAGRGPGLSSLRASPGAKRQES